MDKKEIEDVTVIAVDCTENIKKTVNVLSSCKEKIEFGDIVLLTNRKPRNLPEFITYHRIKKLENIDQYNKFMFLELYKYFDTSHCLVVQYDSGILYPEVWDNEWLQYDYIGAPWLYLPDTYVCHATGEHVRVGNGGFSLRSKTICDLPTWKEWELREEQGFYNEDGNLCVYYRPEMLKEGIRYAPIQVASHFSYENLMSENYKVKPFGFHKHLPIKTWED